LTSFDQREHSIRDTDKTHRATITLTSEPTITLTSGSTVTLRTTPGLALGATPGATLGDSPGITLSDENLQTYTGRARRPAYDRAALVPSVVHFGVGGFSRAHQMVYFDELAQRGISQSWGVVGVGLNSRAMKTALEPQDYLFTVVERGTDLERARVVGVMVDYLFAPEEREALLERLAADTTRLITLTITGNGYPIDARTGKFRETTAGIADDLENPTQPQTVFGYLVEALDRRRRAGKEPFTVLSCDNLPQNGIAVRTAILALATHRDPELARWIERRMSFPSSMVDRITPETTPAQRDRIAQSFGIDDRWPVLTEPFSQWIVEDRFSNGRPPLEQVGVQFVDDVRPYQLLKTRLLNGSHSALGHLGYLAGHRTTAAAMADDVIHEYVAALLDEIGPLLPEADGLDLASYRRSLLARFGNPKISDQLARLCGRGSTKMAAYLLPSLHEALQQGRDCEMLTLALAGWFRYLRGTDEQGREIDVQDPQRTTLQALARRGGSDPAVLLAGSPLLAGLNQYPHFVADLTAALHDIDQRGTRTVISSWLRADQAGAVA
jgi:fructuronate reductase/mannitol 2-dehydrogenase